MVGSDEGSEVSVGEAYFGMTAAETDQVSMGLGWMHFVKLVSVGLCTREFALPFKKVSEHVRSSATETRLPT